MDVENTDDEFLTITKVNHSKISTKMENMGYKDGMHDGQESQFQNCFDTGYEQGFKNGFFLGTFKGSLTQNQAKKTNDNKPSNDLILSRISRGQCVICTDKSLINSSIKDIVENQTNHSEKIKKTLESRYGFE